MKIDFSQKLTALDGEVLKDGEKEVTLGYAAVNVLVGEMPDERQTGEEKYERSKLADKIYGNAEVELTVEEIALIKERIGRGYGAAVVGQAWNMLEGAGPS